MVNRVDSDSSVIDGIACTLSGTSFVELAIIRQRPSCGTTTGSVCIFHVASYPSAVRRLKASDFSHLADKCTAVPIDRSLQSAPDI